MQQVSLPVQTERLWRRLSELARIGADEGGVTRPFPSPAYLAGRKWLEQAFSQTGLETCIDHAGNLHGRLAGRSEGTVILGGHSDTVPKGGAFDGALGVLSGLEIAQAVLETGEKPELSLDVMDCLAEEPSPFGLSCIGSRGYAGRLGGDDLRRQAPSGVNLGDALRQAGGRPDIIGPVDPGRPLRAFLELHIEQGPVLEATPGSLGVVTAIAGIVRHRFIVHGEAAHAGTTPMGRRRDAAVAAAGALIAVHDLASARDGVVATVGELHLSPNVPNVVPGEATGILEVRSADAALLDGTVAACLQAMDRAVRDVGCTMTTEPLKATQPTPMAPGLVALLDEAVASTGSQPVRLPSGGGHDAVEMTARTAVGMLFSPCRGGVSHHPAEWVAEADVDRALRAYAHAVRRLIWPAGEEK